VWLDPERWQHIRGPIGFTENRKHQSGDGVSVDFEQPLPEPPFMHRPNPHIAAQGAKEIISGAAPIAVSHPQFMAIPLPITVAAPAEISRLRVIHCSGARPPMATGFTGRL
jgi:hypothetical protein